MSSPNFFAKLKVALTKKPSESNPADGSQDSSTTSSKSQKVPVEEKKFEPKTREKILQTTLGTEKNTQFHQAIEEASQQNLEGRDFSVYFKESAETLSERFFAHFSKPEEIDLTSQEVLDLTSTPHGVVQEEENPLFCIASLELYEKEEAMLEQIYPDLEKERGFSKEAKESIERELVKSGIPDAMHNTKEGYFYFLLHVDKDNKNEAQHNGANTERQILYGVSVFKQLPVTTAIKEKFPYISRPHIQKAVCIVSKVPIFGSLVSNLEPFAREYLAKSNSEEQQPFNELYEQMESHIKNITIDTQELLTNVSAKRLLYFLKENLIPIWKAILLERRILVYSEHPRACSTFIHSLLSLFPCADYFKYSSKATAFSENHFTEYGFPLKIYHDKCILLPYLGLQHVEEASAAKGFIGGTSNFLIKTLNKIDWHIMIDLDAGKVQFKNEIIKKSLAPVSAEKSFISSINKSLDSKLLKENTPWNKLLDIIIVARNIDTSEGTEEWIRQKFYNYFKDLIAEIEFFKYNVSEQKLGPIVEQYNAAHIPPEQQEPQNGPALDPADVNDSQESNEEESKESIEADKPEEAVDKKKETQAELDYHLGLIKSSMNSIKEYGLDWLLEWSKTDNFREWNKKYRKIIRERSGHNTHAVNHLWFYENGDIYLGGLSRNKRNGYGQFLEREAKMFYKGDWENGKRTGNGMQSSIGGTELVYDGQFLFDKKQGFGRLIKGKERYVGKFINDQYEGNGILIDKDQNVYEGEFQNGQKWGMGKLKFAGGEVYIGQFVEGQLHGQGQYVSPNGDIYSGTFSSDAMTGYGILQMSSGDVYEGGFKEAEFSGRGTLKKSDGFTVEGQFEHGVLMNDQDGMIIYPDGSRYKGKISNYKANGEGVLLTQGEEGATIVKGKFENGQLVEKIKEEYYEGKNVLQERQAIVEKNEKNEGKNIENLASYF